MEEHKYQHQRLALLQQHQFQQALLVVQQLEQDRLQLQRQDSAPAALPAPLSQQPQ